MALEFDEIGISVFFQTVLAFGLYLGVFWAIDQSQLLTVDVANFLEQYGVAFVLATVVIQTVNQLIFRVL